MTTKCVSPYRADVLRTLGTMTERETLVNSALGLCGEAGEFADLIKKWEFHRHTLDIDKVIKELGDIRWYLEVAAHAIGVSMAHIEAKNIEKLKARYPEGFSSEASINRKA